MSDLDAWYARRTYHAGQFELDQLVAAKRRLRQTISLCLPTRNEQATIGKIVRVLREALVEGTPLVDELLVMDAGSADRTREIAAAEGARVVTEAEVLPGEGPGAGKGEGLWKSLDACRGDLMCWVDADVVNIHPRFVTGLLGPLLTEPSIAYVKGFYERPLRQLGGGGELSPTGGGRVTELLARPLLNALWPQLAGIVQPLSGEFAGRRELFERVPFYSDYGVELGLLIDILNEVGIDAIAQVDLERRVHRNQELHALSRMSFAILQTALVHLAEEGRLSEDPWSTLFVQFDQTQGGSRPLSRELAVTRRPPIGKVEAYRRHRREVAGWQGSG
ncbi:MAG TPA: glucosyl-3-phosphoglycerate synthase [Actinomycetes bacterium]|nr:glucosyl-3-phosphoglycerate synthase [Actinomycetes bacterium]